MKMFLKANYRNSNVNINCKYFTCDGHIQNLISND